MYRHGHSRANRHLVLHTFPRSAQPHAAGARLGLSVSRRVGGAVQRNLVKRLLREAFRARGTDLPGDHDYVVVARPEAATLAEREGLDGMTTALNELIGQSAARGALTAS